MPKLIDLTGKVFDKLTVLEKRHLVLAMYIGSVSASAEM